MASPTIERPSVQVIQEFRTVSPTILVPTMPACIMGPCVQVIEAVQDDGSLNPEARIALPARIAFPFVSTPFQYAAIGTDALEVSVNNAAMEQVVFSTGPNLTVDEVVDDILEAAIPGLKALVEVSGTQKRVVIYTETTGENASLEIGSGTHADVRTAFALLVGQRNVGASGYNNYWVLRLGLPDYPDPRDIIDEVVIDYDTVRLFINDGSGTVREVLKTESFLDGATSAVTVQDDGDGDNLSPYLNFAGAVFHDKSAVLTGTVDWTTLAYPGDFGVFTLKVIINGTLVTVTFANPANAAAAILAVNTQLSAAVPGTTAVLNASNQPVITAPLTGVSSSVEIDGTGTINETTIGLVGGRYAAGKPSRARAQGTADLTAVVYAASVQGRVLRMSIDGEQFQQIVFGVGVTDAATLVAAINGLWGAGTAAVNTVNQLVLKSQATFGGKESEIRVDKTASDATLLTALGLTGVGAPFNSVSAVFGNAFSPIVGDEVWVNGVKVGEITEVPATPDNRLRLDVEQLLTYTGSTWFVQAKGIDNQAATASRPSSDLRVDVNSGTVRVKHALFRDTAGEPTNAGPLATYLAYNALRTDVTASGEDFNLLRFGTTTDLEEALAPIDTQNPLGLGMYFALLNAPGVEVAGLGVDETSATEPEGSLDSYTRAFEYLESKDVYAIAPLTHANAVGQVGQVHVDELSKPENGLERIVILNPLRPTRKSDTLVASAATANVAGAPTNVVNTGIADLQAKLAALGKPGPSYVEADGVFLKFEDDENLYLVESVAGANATVNDGPLSASNTLFKDGGGTPVFTAAIVDRPVSVFILGGSLGSRTDEADAYAAISRGYLDRRVIVTVPDQAKASIDGLETAIAGYYLDAGLAGKMSAISPSQPLTNETLAGFSGVIGSQDRYSEMQLKILSGGGLWVFYQEADGTPVKTRHQLSSDMTSIEKREASITRALDFTAKFLRSGLKNFIGRFNITTNVQDAISIVIDGLSAFLIRQGVLKSFEVNAIRQSASAPDTLEIDVTVGVLYPLNYIKITLVI
jgi:hypothetical protein